MDVLQHDYRDGAVDKVAGSAARKLAIQDLKRPEQARDHQHGSCVVLRQKVHQGSLQLLPVGLALQAGNSGMQLGHVQRISEVSAWCGQLKATAFVGAAHRCVSTFLLKGLPYHCLSLCVYFFRETPQGQEKGAPEVIFGGMQSFEVVCDPI